MRGLDYEIKEIHPGQWVKVEKGEVVGEATKKESEFYEMYEDVSLDFDPAGIEIALALAALFGLGTVSDLSLSVRILANMGFFISCVAAYSLYTGYCIRRIPMTVSAFFRTPYKRFGNLLPLWAILSLPFRFFWLLYKSNTLEEAEIYQALSEWGLVALLPCMVAAFVVAEYILLGSFG